MVEGVAEISAADAGTFPLAVIDRPPVRGAGYAIEGRLSYADVRGTGFLQMWSVFPNGDRFFSRTLAASGRQGVITGDSGLRSFALPFFLTGSERPSRLEVDLVLDGSGTVRLGELRLVTLEPGGNRGWWSGRAAGLVGGIGGSLIGILGAVLGALVPRRRARRAVLAVMACCGVVGAILIVVGGAAALLLSQPYAVYFPLLLGGGILTAVFVPGYRRTRGAYADAELRRMRAMDMAQP